MGTSGFLELLGESRRLGVEDGINFDFYNEILLTYHSTSVEGSSLSYDDVSVLITDGLAAKGKPLEHHLMVRDHHLALQFVLEQAKADTEITPGLIRKISALAMRQTGALFNTALGSFDSSKGDFRKVTVHAGRRTFMDAAKVPAAVERLCDDIRGRSASLRGAMDVHDLAFDAHFCLADIHPFADGNGRTSRLLMNFILHRHDMPLSLLFREDKREYINAINESRESGDTGAFRAFMYRQQEKHLAETLRQFKSQFAERHPVSMIPPGRPPKPE
jgi:Fic family protein